MLAAVFLGAGLIKLVPALRDLADRYTELGDVLTVRQMNVVGSLEVLAAAGLVLPASLDIAPLLTPLAACGVICLMLGAIASNFRQAAYLPIALNLVLGGLALFVATERFSAHAL